jgi:hypothetical protein
MCVIGILQMIYCNVDEEGLQYNINIAYTLGSRFRILPANSVHLFKFGPLIQGSLKTITISV